MDKLLLLFLSSFLFIAHTDRTGTMIDTRDGKSYKTLKVGDINLMMQNLNFAADGSTCFRDSEDFCKTYGRVYTYEEAMAGDDYEGTRGVCPEGWHIPTAEEWVYLIQNSGGKLQYKEGSMASALLQKNTYDLKLAGNKSPANDQFYLIGRKGYYMTSSTEDGKWVVVDFSKKGGSFELSVNSRASKDRAISCRCVRYSE